jgi:uncharacterized protein
MKRNMLFLFFTFSSLCAFTQTSADNKKNKTFIQSSKTKEMESLRIVNDFLTAVQTGDHEKVNALADANIHWEQPGNNPFSGTKTSLKQVYEMVGGMSGLTDHSLKLTAVRTLAVNGNSVAALVNWKAKKANGDELDVDNIDVYTVNNGKITRAVVYSADIEKENKYWKN